MEFGAQSVLPARHYDVMMSFGQRCCCPLLGDSTH